MALLGTGRVPGPAAISTMCVPYRTGTPSKRGNIIENAGGPHALKYGVTYNHVLRAEAV